MEGDVLFVVEFYVEFIYAINVEFVFVPFEAVVAFDDELVGTVVFGLVIFTVELFTGTELFDVVFVPFFGSIVLFVVVFATVLLPIEVFVLFVEFIVGAVLLLVEVFVEFEVLVVFTVWLVVLVAGFFVFV